ncbi:MAG: hypothetical protein CMJ78_00165 [Planctomycetaceae bacterium]|nr:hypothetical protein [Planctomycetaceae bacterium]
MSQVAVLLTLLMLASSAFACSVPVFRYALERWPADKFEAIVFHRGTLSDEQKAIVDQINAEDNVANIHAQTIDLDNSPDPELLKFWEAHGTETLPSVMLFYPRTARIPVPAWTGPLNADTLENVMDSPVRRQIARRLIKGESAVWVFLESGDKKKDDASFAILEKELKVQQNKIKLGEIDEADLAQGLLMLDPAELKVKFSTIRLSRKDPKEAIFIETLLGTEEDLRDFDEPMAFPVFGRGRALYALIGKGIQASVIEQAGKDLTGPCTCTIKDQNPGTDLLMSVAWDTLIEPFVEVEKELPPLKGLGGFVVDDEKLEDVPVEEQEGDSNESIEVASDDSPKAESSSPLILNVLISVAVVLGVVVVGSVALSSKTG